MSTEASITIENKENALYVPVEAVYKSGDEKYVLVPATSDDSTQSTKKVTVETGISNDTYVEITSGLAEGDTVQIPIVQSSGNSSQGGMMMPGGGFPGGDFQAASRVVTLEEEMEAEPHLAAVLHQADEEGTNDYS